MQSRRRRASGAAFALPPAPCNAPLATGKRRLALRGFSDHNPEQKATHDHEIQSEASDHSFSGKTLANLCRFPRDQRGIDRYRPGMRISNGCDTTTGREPLITC